MRGRPNCRGQLRLFLPLTLVAALFLPRDSEAQASNYPSLQVPTASIRDYTAAIASGAGTSLIFQWREGIGSGKHLGLDAGITDRKGNENLLVFAGGSIGAELLRANGEQPLDVLLTGGFGLALGGGTTIFRIPAGVSVGHTFELEDGMSLTPFVHPRISLDLCSSCGFRGGNHSELSLNFDIGANFQVNKEFAIRAASVFSGSEFFGNNNAFAIAATWTPAPLRR